jgi:hypothetical protein
MLQRYIRVYYLNNDDCNSVNINVLFVTRIMRFASDTELFHINAFRMSLNTRITVLCESVSCIVTV